MNEYRMVMRCMESSDFKEGVRAMLVDRDMKPIWEPSQLQDVDRSRVTSYFDNLGIDKELNL